MRYILHPGHVYSKTDRQEHFIDAPTLHRLHGVPVPFSRCLVLDGGRPSTFLGFRIQPGDVHLYPQDSYDRLDSPPPLLARDPRPQRVPVG